ncbi:MAG: addiction module toxin, HicA family [Armatimonadetes bacterium]|nr:addiction module toxin, HicA family [Armatimonadota bacterium]NIM22755.1 addiction module toxin, HicA family [Armatimonadota bacterium]NIM66580.1 addiction module toxin, HicA family [Armatimonadota bacterium]NIM75181.1 addiction module toxin, HicA family [Armatimonadota bacterium]NIN04805.1 addiction module toxin, HicA family [Armatimonadota bacterium]
MPNGLPRGLRAEEIIRVFERAGGTRRSGKGSHINIKMPNGQVVTIPAHGEIKVGLLSAAIKKAGLSVEDFLSLLRR